ncbi:uncharacterized protein LOC143260644 isoform X1 [Megalopta genalis]|uniref:uncharacterized protein LOC143260644 isoform X1 n=2 Tax=Megalopta genalis TaxID=115081 RepID=UPI003FD1995C
MDAFQKNYNTYYTVMCITGLLPSDHSLKTNVRRLGFCLLTLCCIGMQVSTLRMVETSLHNVLQTLSFTFPLLLFVLRYVGFIISFPVIKSTIENIQHDFIATKDPMEMDIFMKQITEARRVVMVLVVVSSGGALLLSLILFIPTILQSQLHIRYLNIFGFFYLELNRNSTLVVYQLIIVLWMGLLSLSCTESSLAVIACYLCGLLEITSYRIRTAVEQLANSATLTSNMIDIRSAMDLHQRASELSANITKSLAIPYLVAVLAVVASFAANIYRLFLALGDLSDKENILFCVPVTLVHLFIIYLNNYSGQKLITSSIGLFNDIYDSLWYRIPPKSQKILLFVLMRSSYQMEFSCAGLFVPSNQGFARMMSTSFSYFTTITSVQ